MNKRITVFIIHGSFGHPQENWFPWLKSELEKLGCDVFIPKFPTPENQSLDTWLNIFEEYSKHLDENSIIIGHSLGPAFLLRIIEKLSHQIKAAFFISGFVRLYGVPQFDNVNRTFVSAPFDWRRIRQNCKIFRVFHSNNDPYVPLDCGKELAGNLETELILVTGAGHFNESAGYTRFDLLLDEIKRELVRKRN